MPCKNSKRRTFAGITLKAINQAFIDKTAFINTFKENVAKAVRLADPTSEDGINERLNELQQELVKKVDEGSDYQSVADEILRLRELKQRVDIGKGTRAAQMKHIEELQKFIDSQPDKITEFDEMLVRQMVKKITVFDEYFTVEFKSRIIIKIQNM